MPVSHIKKSCLFYSLTLLLFILIQFIPLISEFGYETSVFWGGFFGIGSCFMRQHSGKAKNNRYIDMYLSISKIRTIVSLYQFFSTVFVCLSSQRAIRK